MYVWYQYFTSHLEAAALDENWGNIIWGCTEQKVVDLSRVVALKVVDLSQVDCKWRNARQGARRRQCARGVAEAACYHLAVNMYYILCPRCT